MTSLAEPLTSTTTAPDSGPATSPFVGRRYLHLVLVLGALSAMGPLTIDTYLPALPQLTVDMGASDAQAQLTITGLLVGGVAPMLAPSLGSALLNVTSWRGIFVVLSAVAVALFVLALVAMPETLPPVRRRAGTVRDSLRGYAGLFRDRLFVVMVVVSGLMFATLCAY